MATPVLYHIEVSHYNEKARWALDYKRIPHVRKAPLPMLHTVVGVRDDARRDVSRAEDERRHDRRLDAHHRGARAQPSGPGAVSVRSRRSGPAPWSWRSSSTRSSRLTSGGPCSRRSRAIARRSPGPPRRPAAGRCTPASRARPRWPGPLLRMRFGINPETAERGWEKTDRRDWTGSRSELGRTATTWSVTPSRSRI